MKSWREKAIVWGTFLLVFLTPVLYFGATRFIPYTTSKTFFFYGGLEIIFALWVYQAAIDASYRLSKREWLTLTPFFVYVLWLTLAGIFGVDFEFSFWSSLGRATGLLTMYHLVTFLILVTSLIKKHGLASYGYRLLGWFIGGASVVALSVWAGNEGLNLPFTFLEHSKGGGLIGNSSLTGTTFVFAIFFEVFLLTAPNIKRRLKIFLGAAIALMLFSPLFLSLLGLLSKGIFVMAVSARGAALGIAVGGLAFFAFFFALSKKVWQRSLGVSLVVIAFVVVLVGWHHLMQPNTALHERFASAAGESRFIFWDIGAKALHERPAFGYGPENYRVAYQTYFDPAIYDLGSTVEVWNDRAHNVFYDIGATSGWPGLIFYFCFLASIIGAVVQAYRHERISRTQASVLMSLVVAYVVQHLFVFDSLLSLLALTLLAALTYGAGMSSGEAAARASLHQKSARPLVVLLLFALFIPVWMFSTWLPSRKAVAFARVIEMPLNDRPDEYASLLRGSPIGNAFEVGAIADDTFHVYSTNQDELKKDEQRLPFALRDLEAYLAYLETIAAREPLDYRLRLSLARLGNVYLNLSNLTKDPTQLERLRGIERHALTLAPNDPQIYWAIAITEYRAGNVELARTTLKKAIEIAPNVEFSSTLLKQIGG